MWYVIQVQAGKEESIKKQCEAEIEKSILERCFIPYREIKRKIRDKWTIKEYILFPGYIFAITDHLEELQVELQNKVTGFTKLIGFGNEIIPLTEEEISFLQKIGGNKQIVGFSKGFITGDKVIVFDGPLIGMEGYIKKIDRHKRKAWIEVDLFGRVQKAEVGLEIVKKWES